MNQTSSFRSLISIADVLFPLFKNSIIVIRVYKIGFLLTFLLGFVSCLLSLSTFMQATFRKHSTGCLFIALLMSNIFYLIICVFDFVEFGLQVRFWHRTPYTGLCRFRTFINNFSQFTTAWFLTFICIDQWIRTRFPSQAVRCCQRKNTLIVIIILLLIDIALHAHILTSRFGELIPQYTMLACGPYITEESYFSFYFNRWSIIQIVLSFIIPMSLMLIIVADIVIYNIYKRASIQPNPSCLATTTEVILHKKQLFIITAITVALLCVTSIPITVYRFRMKVNTNYLDMLAQPLDTWAILTWFQSLNYALNFYLYIFISRLFRKQFRKLFWFIKK